MAASAPSTGTWVSDPESSDHGIDAKSLEIGMAGISLVSGLHDVAPSRKETGSTISSTPPEDEVNIRGHTRTISEPPPSPGSDHMQASNNSRTFVGRPPGIVGANPSPIGKPGHAKTASAVTAATSPLLSLTPNSSVDGNSDWTNRHPSPPGEAPSLPFLTSEHRKASADHSADGGSLESHDMQEQDNDGLLGLEALRAQSTGGGRYSTSPPIARGHLPSHDVRQQRERPPLGQPFSDDRSSHGGDRSVGERSTGSGGITFPQNGANFDVDSRGFGAIARPELRHSVSDLDHSRLRSASGDSSHSQPFLPSSGFFDQGHMSQKFGSLPSLGSHIRQQGVHMQHPGYSDVPKPRHMRSVSQPVQTAPASIHGDPRMYNMPYSVGNQLGSSALSNTYESGVQYGQKRSQAYGHMNPGLDRRDALDFQLGSQTTPSMMEEMRMFGMGQNSMHVHYGGHTRQSSESGSTMLSSSPMSMGSSMLRNHAASMHGGRFIDEDLSHPLIGEHIEVPADHYGDGQFLINNASSLPLMRHSHSLSMDQIPNNFIEGSHLPTAGAGLPHPKVVYIVKFKRTQRNFVLGPRITRDLKIGTYVKVEADRGEDLGIVVGRITAEKFNMASRTQYTAGMGPPGGMGATHAADLKRIIRLATHDEVSLIGMKREEEEELLKICRGKVRQRGLPMNVVDAEYQFDRHKLTFFFEAEGRVDFRELVRDLFSMYKTRIWMQQLDKNNSASSPAMVAPPAANFQMDYGTPIIAPASEFADSVHPNSMGDARSY